jgi:hypothetical protein
MESTHNHPHGHSQTLAISGKMPGVKNLFPPVLHQSNAGELLAAGRRLNAVSLQCAECDVVSDSPHDICMVCGSRSLVNIRRILGGKMPRNRAELVKPEPVKINREMVLHFPKPHPVRRRLSV